MKKEYIILLLVIIAVLFLSRKKTGSLYMATPKQVDALEDFYGYYNPAINQ